MCAGRQSGAAMMARGNKVTACTDDAPGMARHRHVACRAVGNVDACSRLPAGSSAPQPLLRGGAPHPATPRRLACRGRADARRSPCSEGRTVCTSRPAAVTITKWAAVQKNPSNCGSPLRRLERRKRQAGARVSGAAEAAGRTHNAPRVPGPAEPGRQPRVGGGAGFWGRKTCLASIQSVGESTASGRQQRAICACPGPAR